RAQQGAVGQASRGDRARADWSRHPQERDHLDRHGRRAPAGHPRRHAGEEGEEPAVRDPGSVLGEAHSLAELRARTFALLVVELPQLVAHAAYRLEQLTGGAELAAQVQDMGVDGADAPDVAVAPDPRQELLAREDAARALDEKLQQLEL